MNIKLVAIILLGLGAFWVLVSKYKSANELSKIDDITAGNKTQRDKLLDEPAFIASEKINVSLSKGFDASDKDLLSHEISEQSELVISSPLDNQTSSNSIDDLDALLSSTPANYHSLFQWRERKDEALIAEYLAVSQQSNNALTSESAINYEQLLFEEINRHDLNTQITIESLQCNQVGCIVYGGELQSGAWSQILSSAQGQAWWQFIKNETRSGVGEDGNLTFITVLR